MHISWYLGGGNELFETDGELPHIGEIVYVSAFRGKSKVRSKYKVVESYHSVTLHDVDAAAINEKIFIPIPVNQITDHQFNRFEQIEEYIKQNIGYPYSWNLDKAKVQCSSRKGEVILELFSDADD